MSENSPTVLPGAWLGMLGGGQLGRMFCHSAQALGYKVAVLDPDAQSPAGAVADLHIRAAYDDDAALEQLAERCAALTTEFENVPAATLRKLAEHSSVRPNAHAVATVQDRIEEKAFLRSSGVPVAPYLPVTSAEQLRSADDTLFPGILKVARLGYDGKGQVRVADRAEAERAFVELGGQACVLEAMLPLAREISIVLARGVDGSTVVYPPATNVHVDGILAVSSMDAEEARCTPLACQAESAALRIAEALQYVGVLCVEFFVLEDGSLVANEIAPRPHNSGHYTMNASISSQFEQQVRATAGMPLGDTGSLCSVVMLNILGDVWFADDGSMREPAWEQVLKVPGAKLHLYGKAEARRGRKMGHINIIAPTLSQARERARQVAEALDLPAGWRN